jgi:hypothetical protein
MYFIRKENEVNERIKELIENSGCTYKQKRGVYQFHAHELEAFAESIVRECTAFVFHYPEKYLTRKQAREICVNTDRHFGIE